MRVGRFAFKGKIQLVTEKKDQCSQRRFRRCRGKNCGRPDWRCSWRGRSYCLQLSKNQWDRHICVHLQEIEDTDGCILHWQSDTDVQVLEGQKDTGQTIQLVQHGGRKKIERQLDAIPSGWRREWQTLMDFIACQEFRSSIP